MRVPITRLLLIVAATVVVVLVANTVRTSDQPGPASPTGSPRAAILFPGPVRFFDVFEGYLREAAEREGLELDIFDAGWSPATQANQLDLALSSGANVVALAAVDNLALAPAVRLSHQTGVPLITFTNGIGNEPTGISDGIVAHVGRDELRSGRLLGQQIALMDQERLDIASIEGSPGTTPQRLRNRGLVEEVETRPGWTLVLEAPIEDWRIEEVARQVDVLLARDLGVDVIATQWADAAVAVVDALRRHGRDDIAVVALEFTESVREEMLAGRIRSTSVASVRQEAELTVATALAAARGTLEPGFVEVDQGILSGPADARTTTPEW